MYELRDAVTADSDSWPINTKFLRQRLSVKFLVINELIIAQEKPTF